MATLSVPAVQASTAKAVYGFQCYRIGEAYTVGLGYIKKPFGGVALSSTKIQPLVGSGSLPVAWINTSIGHYPLDRRCNAIATRLTNILLATGNATPLGVINLTRYLVPGVIDGQQVIAVENLNLGDVIATIGNGMTAQDALGHINTRIRRIATGQALANALNNADVVTFEVIQVQ